MSLELPDLFLLHDGQRLRKQHEWADHRVRLISSLLALQYGELPAAPAAPQPCELLHTAKVRDMQGAQLHSLRVRTGHKSMAQFGLQVWTPSGKGPWPVIVTGDACWNYTTDVVKAQVLGRGFSLAQFNRVELAADVAQPMLPAQPAQPTQPTQPTQHAAIATWAWGYHRCVDALLQLDFINPSQIAVVGHSRGGKAALLAGATDERIAITSANSSGAGGAGCYRWLGQGAETMADIVQCYPHWFSPRLAEYTHRVGELPFDQHTLKALVAPRALLSTEALDDVWANPEGTWQTYLAAREVYRFLGAEQRIAIHWRAGAHAHTLQDWCALLDFADTQWHSHASPSSSLPNPFAALPPSFHWAAPPLPDATLFG